MPRKLTTDDFIKKAIAIHGDRYNYSHTSYVGSHTPINIVCNECGNTFSQTPNTHLNNHGCPICNGSNKKTTESFIEEARRIHADRYGYEQVEYVNNHTKIIIKCLTCGSVWKQRPIHHLNGHGCRSCSQTQNSHKRKVMQPMVCFPKRLRRRTPKTTDQFIKEAVNKHGQKYNYRLVEYVGAHEKVIIICNTCGKQFEQTPHSHRKGQGCPHCLYKRQRETGEILLSMFDRVARQASMKINAGKKPFCFDYQVQDNKTFVEYHGEQHYKPIKYMGGLKKFNLTQKRDRIKADWCKRVGWNLIVVPYWIDDIKSFLEQEFAKIPTS